MSSRRYLAPEGLGKKTETAAQIENPAAILQIKVREGLFPDVPLVRRMAPDQGRCFLVGQNTGEDLGDLQLLGISIHGFPLPQ
jgi:hypothetical protein